MYSHVPAVTVLSGLHKVRMNEYFRLSLTKPPLSENKINFLIAYLSTK